MPYNQNSEDEQKISKYNAGVAIQIRLNNLWQQTHKYSLVDRYYLWNTVLDRIWLELSRDLKEKEYIEKKKLYDEFNYELTKTGKIVDAKDDNGFLDPTKEEYEKREKQYKILMDKQIWLARLENELGKGTAWDEGDEYDFD